MKKTIKTKRNYLTYGVILYPYSFNDIYSKTDLYRFLFAKKLSFKNILNIKESCSQQDFDCFRQVMDNKKFSVKDAFFIKENLQNIFNEKKGVPFYYIYPIVFKINEILFSNITLTENLFKEEIIEFNKKYSTFFNFIYFTYLLEEAYSKEGVSIIKDLFYTDKEVIIKQGMMILECIRNRYHNKTEIGGTDYIYSFLKKDVYQFYRILDILGFKGAEVRFISDVLNLEDSNIELQISVEDIISSNFKDIKENEIDGFLEFIESRDNYHLLSDSISESYFKKNNDNVFYLDDKAYHYKKLFPLCFKAEVIITSYVENVDSETYLRSILSKIINNKIKGSLDISNEDIKTLTNMSDKKNICDLFNDIEYIKNKKTPKQVVFLLKMMVFRNYFAHHSYSEDFFLKEKGGAEVIESCVNTLFIFFRYKEMFHKK